MSERIYACLLRLFPAPFRGRYGEEALQMFRDRSRDETGFIAKLRLWLDLLADLAISLPREYQRVSPVLMVALTQPSFDQAPNFRVLEEEWLRPGRLLLGSVLALFVLGAAPVLVNQAGHPQLLPLSTARTRPPARFRSLTPSATAGQQDDSPHKIQFIPVDKDVKLEVLDWGGTGRAVVFLAGLGNTAHIFDKFAPKLGPSYHVYGITRRGFGASSAPVPEGANYTADRLGDDVLAVRQTLRLQRPVLIGHSMAGEELSSIGSRHPEQVSGLVYLDAGYGYAYYDQTRGDLLLDLLALEQKLQQLKPGHEVSRPGQLITELLVRDLPQFEKDLRERQTDLQSIPSPPSAQSPPRMPAPAQAIVAGQQKYTKISVPVLAIYAVPHNLGSMFKDPAVRAKAEARDEITVGAQARALEQGIPSARVIRLPHADHFVFLSNEADVLSEVNTFLRHLPE